MRSTRSITWLLVVLVLVPTVGLTWLGFHAADAFDAAANTRLKTELDEASRLLSTAAPSVRAGIESDIDRILAARAERLARDLPLLDRQQGLSHIASTALDFLPLDLVLRRVRLLDARGESVYWATHQPHDASPDLMDATTEVFLTALRRAADRAFYGREGVEGALSVWRRARAAFRTPLRRATADAEMARLRVRAGASAVVEARSLDAVWPEALLTRVGRPALLLWLAASGSEPYYLDRLAGLWRRTLIARTPLTAEERRRFAEAVSGTSLEPPATSEQWGIAFEHEVAGGARLQAYVATGRLMPLFRNRLQARFAGHSVEVAAGLWPSHLDDPTGAQVSEGLEVGRRILVDAPGGVRALVRLQHAEWMTAVFSKRKRRFVVTLGVVSLFLMSVLGLALTRRAVQREHAARRLRDDFIANVTHEVRTPLTSVLLHSELLLDPAQDEAHKTAHAEVVQAEGKRLATLVDGLLDFAALEGGTRRLEPGPIDLAAASADAIAPYTVLAEREGRVIACDAPTSACEALADATGVARVLANVVGNAWKHGGPAVHVHVGTVDGGPFVEVRDDGAGIAHEERARVFERFGRGHGAEAKPGVGIGLSLARDLARAMGGELELLDDDTETVFRLTLPPVPEIPA